MEGTKELLFSPESTVESVQFTHWNVAFVAFENNVGGELNHEIMLNKVIFKTKAHKKRLPISWKPFKH